MLTTGGRPRDQEWPNNELEFQSLLDSGWQPVPFRQFILKMSSLCNLSCTYCYVYHQADQSWRQQPATMSVAIVDAAAGRIAEHARRHSLDRVHVILHGGEPLLAGSELLAYTVARVRGAVEAGTAVEFSLQTNGTLLDADFLELCLRNGISVGVSIDGDGSDNDRRRIRRNGKGSHSDIGAGLRMLTSDRFRPAFAGLLCVADLASDPVDVYESLLTWGPPSIDILLPHGNWTSRPPGRSTDEMVTPYGDWLGILFDRWYTAIEHETDVRLFQEIVALLLGGHSRVETIGLSPSTALVIEADGSIEQVDALKSAYHGAASTGLSVTRNGLDDAFRHPGILARQIGTDALSNECMQCAVHKICGGGYYPHRYRSGSGFRNRSVYCPDLFALILTIGRRLRADIEKIRHTG